MSPEKELTEKILAMTMKIQKEHPEFSKFLEEMPITIPTAEHPVIDIKSLNDYYQSLVDWVKKAETGL